jgi:formylglycine-generating enzyme required for sulfatase activity
MAWYANNSGNTTHPVGTKQPNAFGLFDMHGNVQEWCMDLYYEHSYLRTPAEAVYRSERGGSWDSSVRDCRSAFRAMSPVPDYRSKYIGFRIVMILD